MKLLKPSFRSISLISLNK